MATALGLDIGTNSIGWCLYEVDRKKNDCQRIIDIGVRIFSDGRDPKSGASLAVDRRDARSARRRRDRYLGRRKAILKTLRQYGLLPRDQMAAKALEKIDPYNLRVKALDEQLEPHHIGRALFHLNQRRGFKSNRKADRVSKAGEDGKIASGTKALDEAMRIVGARSLGEFLYGSDQKRVRMRDDSDGYDFYPDRKHYEQEFDAIWTAQSVFHPNVLTDDAKQAITRILFFQRPLKAQIVGKCTFAGWNGVPDDEKRLPKAHPLFQQRRLYEEVNQLEIAAAGEPSRKLTVEERDALIMKLRDKKKVTFTSLAKVIKMPSGSRFNKESENRKDLLGDEVRAAMSDNKRFGSRWPEFSIDEQWEILEKLQEEENTEKLLACLMEKYDLNEVHALAIANAPLPDGHGRFGITATRILLDELKKDVLTYSKAAELAGFHHSDLRTGECLAELPYYGEILAREIAPGKEDYGDAQERQFGKITNPTVHIGMNQLRKLINGIIKKHGIPDDIYVELARELKLNDKQKAQQNKILRQNTAAAQARSEKLVEMGQRDTGSNRMMLKLWEDLNPNNALDRRCPYCPEKITADMLMNGSVDVDHIIPYSRCLDDGFANKTLCHAHCNRQKGQKTPYEKWGDTDRWPVIQDQVKRMHKSKQWRFAPDAMERVERDGGFITRQLTDTQYLSRLAAKYLSALYPEKGDRHVYAVTGRMTAMLRRLWGLNDILPDHNWVENEHSNASKNRLDHRHHAIDAAVVGATSPSMIQKIAKAAGRAEDQDLDKSFDDLPKPWESFREDLRDRLLTTTISHKADHGRTGKPSKHRDITTGKLHNDTAYGLTGRTNAKGAPIVVTRKPLLSLKATDLTNPERMTDHALQNALQIATQGRTGKDFETALRDFAKRDGPYKGIRRVRLCEPLNVIPIKDKDGIAYKSYLGDANEIYNVWRLPNGKWTHNVISTYDYHQRGFVEQRPHPAAKRIMTLRQDDCIAIERDGEARKIMRIQKYGQNGQIFLIEHSEAGNMVQRNADIDDPFKFYGPSASSLQKMKARKVHVDELGHIYDPGPRD